MSQLTRKRVVHAKIESVYGTDPTPASSNAILVKHSLAITPLQASLVSRDVQRPYLGNSQQLMSERAVKIDFEVEMVGSGTVGLAPAYDALLRACAMVPTVNTAVLTSITRASAVATATLNSHGFAVGDKVVISGCNETDYNGTFAITAVTTNTFSYAVANSPTSPATGSPVVNLNVTYAPVSASFQSVTIYHNNDGVLHKITGAMGTVEFGLAVKQIPTMKFSFIGLYNAPTDTAALSTDYSLAMIPQVAGPVFTPSFSVLGFAANLTSYQMNVANSVQHILYAGSGAGNDTVKIIDRAPAGTVVFEAPAIASKDFFGAAVNQTPGDLLLGHGSVNGFKVKIDCPNILLGNVGYSDSNGVQMLNAPFTANPTSGNDEFTIAVA